MLEKSYIKFLDDLKIQIKQSRIKAHLSVNRELILLYYKIGLAILEKQKEEGWGTKIIERVAKDFSGGNQKAFLENKKSFEDLARQFSEGPSAKTGGDVDWGARHKLLPEYYEAALALKNIGETSDLVETPYGIHIIKLTGKKGMKFLVGAIVPSFSFFLF